YLYPAEAVLAAFAGGWVFAVTHVPDADLSYKELQIHEMDRLESSGDKKGKRQKPDISPEIYYRTLELIGNAGDLKDLYEAWRPAQRQAAYRRAFRKFLSLFIDRLAT